MLRAAMMLLGLAYHATWAYMPGIGRWYLLEDPHTSPWMAPLAATLHAFRMEAFFALAGFFAHLGVERRGARDFLADRWRRLGWPLLAGLPVVVLVDVGSRQWALAAGRLSPDYAWGAGLLLRPLHLWFLEYLLLFVLLAAGLSRWRAPWLATSARWALRFPDALLGLGLFTFAIRWGLGEATPAFSLVPQPAAVAHYGLFFVFGWALWAVKADAQRLGRGAWARLGVGLAVTVWVVTRDVQWRPEGFLLGALGAWACVLGVLGVGFSLTLSAGARAKVAWAVDASYWVYLVHYPFVLALQLALAPAPLPAGLKFALVLTGAAALAVASWELAVRRTRVGAALGARR